MDHRPSLHYKWTMFAYEDRAGHMLAASTSCPLIIEDRLLYVAERFRGAPGRSSGPGIAGILLFDSLEDSLQGPVCPGFKEFPMGLLERNSHPSSGIVSAE